jgi:hypothetical protein
MTESSKNIPWRCCGHENHLAATSRQKEVRRGRSVRATAGDDRTGWRATTWRRGGERWVRQNLRQNPRDSAFVKWGRRRFGPGGHPGTEGRCTGDCCRQPEGRDERPKGERLPQAARRVERSGINRERASQHSGAKRRSGALLVAWRGGVGRAVGGGVRRVFFKVGNILSF